jgi:molybdopterin/thiamine biosynthesis adenylyltransferase/rhodanese-related sulfurtransferase/proteasome lid subunit RPN8/RPN11
MNLLFLPQSVDRAIRGHGEQDYPNECCGVLLGHRDTGGWRVALALRARNATPASPRTHYAIAPAELARIHGEARRRGLEIAGFYHSHPDRPAAASATDLAEAHWLGCSYVIVTVAGGQAEAAACYRLAGTVEEDKFFEPETIVIEDESSGSAVHSEWDRMPAFSRTPMPTDPQPAALPELTPADLSRYARHLTLPEVGIEGQRKLKAARVLCIGVGGLGSPLALYLAAAGVGTLGLVDFDVVDASNLQRQVLHSTPDVGRSKLDSAAEKLAAINPAVRVVKHPVMLSSANALEIFADYDMVADGTDNFPTRYLVNDACVLAGKPNVYGSIFRFEGQASVFATSNGPCYRCLYPEPPPPGTVPSCAEGGVLGILPGLVGIIQATEVVKLILGGADGPLGESLIGRLLLVDALAMRFRELRLRKNPDCPVCGTHPTLKQLIDYPEFCGMTPSQPKENTLQNGIPQITATELKRRLDAGEDLVIIDVREPWEYQLANLGARLIPLNEIPQRLHEIERDREIVVHCKMGGRSQRAAEFLAQSGFPKVTNLSGGITAWTIEVDPSLPKY